ncbi:MAG: hypothetical protein ACR2P4_09175 [Gammaproteobacteria bacterium]
MTKTITDILRPFLVVLFIFGFGSLTACGGGGGGNTAMTMSPPPPVTMTTAPPVTLGLNSPEIGALHYNYGSSRYWLVVMSVAEAGKNITLDGESITLERLSVTQDTTVQAIAPDFNRATLHATGDLVPLVNGGVTTTLANFQSAIAFETIPSISMLTQLCPAAWLATYINTAFSGNLCGAQMGLSYTPNMPNVLHAAMADTFHRGIGIGESRFAFSGRHNGNDRAAGFTYDMGGYALRTDYVHLPSKQDGAVFLDTFRFGIIRPINDETRFFAGVDSYRNAIFAIDTNGENLHRFGIAAGDGYAVRYEYRIRL